ncbi:MAG TPA: ABC transporter permease [Candidatus Acidoferrum sp.]|nr:ABC transporter permease [Candidatus Acidoferrum sp.]
MTWLARLLRREKQEHQLDKELLFHIEQHAADLISRGATPDEARRRARVAIGGPEQVKEKCRDARGTRWLEDLAQDTRYALRTFRQKPAFAAISILVLALGVGATTLMFGVINGVLLNPLAFPQPEQLLTLHGSLPEFGDFWGYSYPDFTDIRRESHSLEIGAWTFGGGTISQEGEPEVLSGYRVSSEFFTILKVQPQLGRIFRPDEDRPGAPPVAVLSDSLWRRRFAANPAVIGTTLTFDGGPITVIGVMPHGFQVDGDVDIYRPLATSPDTRMQFRRSRFLHVIARLKPGAALPQAQTELALFANNLARLDPTSNANLMFATHRLQQDLVGDIGGTLWLLLSAVGLVLLVACVNIASLLLARAVSRERELAMRVALGANRGRLIRQCLTESAVLGICGGLLGLAIAAFATRPFVALWPGDLPRAEEIHLDARMFLFAVAISLASGFLFGLAPAFRVPVRNLESALRLGGRAIAGSSRRLHSVFVIAEIALAFVLLVSAGMLGRTLLHLSSLDPGVNVHNVLTARFALSPATLANPDQIRPAWQEILARMSAIPGIQSATLSDIIPMRVGENSLPYSTTPAPPPTDAPLALASSVTPGYISVMQLKLREGRFIADQDRLGSEPVVVIDENFARHAFNTPHAVGKSLWIPALSSDPVKIVGVVGHVRHWGLASDDQSRVRDQMYYPFAQVPVAYLRFFSTIMSIAVRTNADPAAIVQPLGQALRGAAGDQAIYGVETLENLATASLARQRFLSLLFGIFAGVALLLACIGLYGVLAYLTGERVPEFGVRIALGASASDVVRLVLRQSFSMIVIGVAAGLLASIAATQILRRTVEGMQPAQLSTFVLTVALLLATALVASLIPARRASRVDPVEALRQD